MSATDTLRFLPAATRATVETLSAKMNLEPAIVVAAILALDAFKGLTTDQRRKALAVMVALEGRAAQSTTTDRKAK